MANKYLLPHYHFTHVYVVLHLREFFETRCLNWRNVSFYYLQSLSTNHESWLKHTAEFSSNALKRIGFCLVVFVVTVSMPCVHIRRPKSYVSKKFNTYFQSDGMNEWNFSINKTLFCSCQQIVSKNSLPDRCKTLTTQTMQAKIFKLEVLM